MADPACSPCVVQIRQGAIPLSDEAPRIVRELPRRRGVPWLFYNPRTERPPRSVFHTWSAMRSRLGRTDVRLHDLRHSFAGYLVNSGCSLYEAQKILGHDDPRVTMRYAHLAPESLIRAANLVGRSVKGDSERDGRAGREKEEMKQ